MPADLLRDLGLASANGGMETDYLPSRDMDELRDLLPDVWWEPSQGVFARLRMIKTPREADSLKRLSRITSGAIQHAFSSVKAGSTEMDLAGAVTHRICEGEQLKGPLFGSGVA